MLTIQKITRGHVEFMYSEKKGKIFGEALLPGHGSVGYVLYENSFTNWDPPDDETTIDANEKKIILQELLQAFIKRGQTAEIE